MVESERKRLTPYRILVFLFAAAWGGTWLTGTPTYDPSLPVNSSLPPCVGEWRGIDILFCQNGTCGRQYTETDLGGHQTCLACGSRLDAASPAERGALPPDSLILRRRYENDQGEWVSVAVVVSGRQRSSIHRPEWCLPGQGLRIVGSESCDITLSPGHILRVVLMDVTVASDGKSPPAALAFAYWFCSPGLETASQLGRLGWMAWDSVIHGATYRWAYVTISTPQEEGSSDRAARLKRFLPPFWAEFRVHSQGGRSAIQSAPSRETL